MIQANPRTTGPESSAPGRGRGGGQAPGSPCSHTTGNIKASGAGNHRCPNYKSAEEATAQVTRSQPVHNPFLNAVVRSHSSWKANIPLGLLLATRDRPTVGKIPFAARPQQRASSSQVPAEPGAHSWGKGRSQEPDQSLLHQRPNRDYPFAAAVRNH